LIQGWYACWEQPALVSCPIARYSRVTVWLEPEPAINAPNGYFKVRQAARLLLDILGRPNLGATIQIDSQLLPGRGMASSTADVVGVLFGLSTLLDQPITPEQAAGLACQIEPSDSLMFPGLALLAYRYSGTCRRLGPAPQLPLLMLDPGYTIDTLAYNARLDLSAIRSLAPTTGAALDLLCQGLAAGDAQAIGAAATLSATHYQKIAYNPLVDSAQSWAHSTGAAGLVRAHSGSLVGLLYPPDADVAGLAQWLSTRFDGRITATHLTNTGCQLTLEESTIAR
jgi:L-threonine kinase